MALTRQKKEDIIQEFQKYDKDIRTLSCRILLEKFNEKYDSLNPNQKLILKEVIYFSDSNNRMTQLYESKISEIKKELKNQIDKTNDLIIKIKLNEIYNIIQNEGIPQKIRTDNLTDLLQYFELIEELKVVNE